MKSALRLKVLIFTITLAFSFCTNQKNIELHLSEGEKIVIIGNTFAEQMQKHSYFETLLQTSFPESKLQVRNLGWSADEIGMQPRPLNFGSLDSYLTEEKADYILACYGMNESFKGPDSLPQFERDLEVYLAHLSTQNYNGHKQPTLILVSPIAYENKGGLLPDAAPFNKNIVLYTEAMRRVASKLDIAFIDLFGPTLNAKNTSGKMTFNGIHLTDDGYRVVAELMSSALAFPTKKYVGEQMDDLRNVIQLKNQHYFYKYRAVNGEYIYGRRNKPYGLESFPPEMEKLSDMVFSFDSLIWLGIGKGNTVDLKAVDALYSHTSQYEPFQRDAAKEDLPSVEQFTMMDGYQIELFASEHDFPIGNATSFTFDPKGRLWVSTLESFPHVLPGSPPNDKLVVLEDIDQDGRADKHTVFADGLYEPLGFELGDGGVYISQPPNLIFLKDTNDDLRADVMEPLLYGFGTEDVHHTISAFTWGPDGALYMHDGTFLHDQVETPYGPVRSAYATTWRYEPYTRKLTQYISYSYANPWGNVFLRNGMHLIGDASGGENYYATPMTVAIEYPFKHMKMDDFPTTRIRPTCGIEIIQSSHFPKAMQGVMLQPNVLGFQGIKQYEIERAGSGIVAKELDNLLQSSDLNFRPVDLQIGPDGALYILDFSNPIVGHMTYSFRDPKRDHVHGRIWRVTKKGSELKKVKDLSALGVLQLLDELKSSEDRVRYRSKIQLREFGRSAVIEKIDIWLTSLDKGDEEYDQHRLEALWVCQQFHYAHEELIDALLGSGKGDVRAAATRVLYYWNDMLPGVEDRLIDMSRDSSARVRLEAAAALSHFKTEASVSALLNTTHYPVDYYHYYTLNEAFKYLRPVWLEMFRKNSAFLKDDPRKTYYLMNSVIAEASLSLYGYIKEDPENAKYSVQPFTESDYDTFSDVPAIASFWAGSNQASSQSKMQAFRFIAEQRGISIRDAINDRLVFLKSIKDEFSGYFNWKVREGAKKSDRNIELKDLEDDVKALTEFLESYDNGTLSIADDLEGVKSVMLGDTILINLSTVPGQMIYDAKSLTVVAGKPVKIIFMNPDHMQHNLLITKPGTMETIGLLAEEMAREPDAFEKNFIPDSDDVLFSTPLLNGGEQFEMNFTAPTEEGEYPYLCTFPGHWRIMNGTMQVVRGEL